MLVKLSLWKRLSPWRCSLALTAYNDVVRSSRPGEHATIPTTSLLFTRGILASCRKRTKQWNRMSVGAQPQDVAALCDQIVIGLETQKYTRSSSLNEIFDNVMSAEDLKAAEEALECFRRSLSKPRNSLPLVVVRACIRVGQPWRALHIIRNKKTYGVFPSAKVYNILMDSFLTLGNTKRLLDTYQDLISQETKPNATTCMLAALGYASLGTDDSFEQAKLLCLSSWKLRPKIGSEAFCYTASRLIDKEQKAKAKELMSLLNEQGPPLSKYDLRFRLCILGLAGDLDSALYLLQSVPSELCSVADSITYQRLSTAVKEIKPHDMAARLKDTQRSIS